MKTIIVSRVSVYITKLKNPTHLTDRSFVLNIGKSKASYVSRCDFSPNPSPYLFKKIKFSLVEGFRKCFQFKCLFKLYFLNPKIKI
jgi:hypothetical protein